MERTTKKDTRSRRHIAGNALAMVFMAVGMAGVVTYGLNNIMRGPAVTAAETSRRTIAENNLVATTRLAISAAAQMQSNNGDCDSDGFVEPVPFRTAPVGSPAPAGGGLVPMTIGASMTDPWGAQYGYCVWDPGTVSQSDNHTACGNGAGEANRLQGAPRDDQPAIAVISAGKNGVFETTCNPYVDDDGDGLPDDPLVVENADSDDIVLTYTYAEANGIGGGLWRLRESDPATAEIDRSIRSTSRDGATFGGAVELTNRGIVLPGDPGDNSVTGECDAAKNGQLRRNLFGSPPAPPTIEMCDHDGGNGWIQIAGNGDVTPAGGFNPELGNCTLSESGPLERMAHLGFVGDVDRIPAIWTGPGRPTQQIFASAGLGGLFAITFDGTTLTHVTRGAQSPSSSWVGIWSDGANIFGSTRWGSTQELAAFTYDGTNFIESAPRVPRNNTVAHSITGTEGVVFTPNSDGATFAYSFNGSSFTQIASDTDALYTSDVWTDGTNVYSISNELHSAQWNGSAFTNRVSTTGGPGGHRVWADSTYIYTLNEHQGIAAYTFDGTNFTEVARQHAATSHNDLWGDGVNLYAATENGLRVYRFDGIDFHIIAEDNSIGTGATSVWGDGNYIYVGTDFGPGHTGSFHVFRGFGCLDPNPDGGSPVVTPVPTSRQTALPEPIDVGLIAHWKMDELSGETTVTDSVGSNHGERLDNASTTFGQDGGMALNLAGPTTTGAVRINGLLGSPQQGTIAGWVNLGSPTAIAGSTPDRAMILSIGDYVNLYENYDNESTLNASGLVLEVRGGSLQSVRSDFQLTNAGWRYVVATFDTVDEMFRIYVDGKMVAQENQAWSINYSGAGSNTFIGRHGNGAANWGFNGSVDDFRVYDRALGPTEVATLSARALSGGETAAPVLSPLHVAGRAGKLTVSNLFGCAIKTDGTAWCWGMDDGSGNLGFGKFGVSSRFPRQVIEPSQFVYYLNNTNSALSVGGATFDKKMLPYMQSAQASTGAFAASQARTAYGYTDPGMPGVTGATGSREYTVKMRLATPDACLSAGAIVARINNGGTVQSSVTLAPAGASNALSSTVTLKATGDLGTFTRTDRLRVQYNVTNTCGSARAATNLIAELHAPLKPQTPWTHIDTSCAIKGDGTAWCWGYGGEGHLGNSSFTNASQSSPSPVVNSGLPWVSTSGPADHTCGIQSDGSLWCWGDDWSGQLGNGATAGIQYEPVRVGTDTDWAMVKSAYTFSCAIKRNGTLWCWGGDDRQQLGNGATNTTQVSPVRVSDAGPWINLAVSNQSACAIKSDSSLWCWGANDSFKLGTQNGDTNVPTRIWNYPDGWVEIAQGNGFTCGIRKDGNVYCWGEGDKQARGWSQTTHIPQRVFGLSNVVSLAVGSNACAAQANGAIFCWGWNGHGTLGDGFYRASGEYPTAVLGFPGQPGWGWNETQSIIAGPYNFNVGLNGSMIGDVANNSRGFGFTSPGRARVYQNTGGGVQLGLQAGAGGSSLLNLRTRPAMGAVDVTYDLMGRWPLDTNANASVGGVNGTNNGATFVAERKVGTGAILFDGVDDNVEISRSASVMEHTDFSIAFWMRRSGNQAPSAYILNKFHSYAEPWTSYLFALNDNQSLVFYTGHTDNTAEYTTAIIPDEKWTHVVGTFSHTGTNNLKLYIDGKLVDTAEKPTHIIYDNSANGRLYLGGCASCPGYFKGALDDVRIYRRTLSANDVAILYGTQLAASAPDFTMGVNAANNRFQVSTPTDTLMNIQANGLTGIGAGVPTTRLDVQGGVRFGTEAACDSNRTGAMRYTGGTPPWSYCNGTSWVALGGAATGAPWKVIDAAWWRACGIRMDGALWCWGDAAELGNDNDPAFVTVPVRVHTNTDSAGWNDWIRTSSSVTTTCGIRANGTAWCWGPDYEGVGKLGDGTTVGSNRPSQVRTSGGGTGWNDWIRITTGGSHGCGVRSNGTLWCWGWGENTFHGAFGMLGNGANNNQSLPVQVITDSGPGAWEDWVDVAAAHLNTCGIRADGSAWCWGDGRSAQHGNEIMDNTNRPVRVRTDAGTGGWNDWVKIIPGAYATCGLRANGSLWCWGPGWWGMTGGGSGGEWYTYPSRVRTDTDNPAGWNDWVDFDSEMYHACGIRADGSAWCWGSNEDQQLGNGLGGPGIGSALPVRVLSDTGGPGWSDWVQISTGADTSCGMRADGSAWCWGNRGEYGRLGDGIGDQTRSPYPVRVSQP